MTRLPDQRSDHISKDPIFDIEESDDRSREVLRQYDISEARSQGAFDRFLRLASGCFEAEIVFVAFLHDDQGWLQEQKGLTRAESRLSASFCTSALKADAPVLVEDTRELDGDASRRGPTADLRSYAGVSIQMSEGRPIGTLSILDRESRSFSDKQKRQLEDVGEMISEKLERRRQVRKHDRHAENWKEMSRRFEAILQDPSMMVGVLDTDGTLLETNETSLQYIEAGREEVIGEPFWETPWWDEKDRENVRAWVEQAAEGEYVEYEAGVDDAENRSYWVEGTIRPVTRTGEEGEEQVEALVVSARDVTERERSRKKLENYREYTDRLLDDVDDLFFALDEEAQAQRWNQSVSEVTGYSDEEIAEMSAFDFVPEGDRERVAQKISEVLAAGSAQIEVPLLLKDGTTVSYEFAGSSLKHPEKGRQVVGIGRDISERKERERRLQQAEVLFQNAQDAFFLLDVREEREEKRFAYRRVNPVYEKQFGHSEEEIRGCSPRDVFGEELGQFMEGRCRTCARRGEPLEYEEEIPLEGSTTYWLTRIAPVFVEGEVQQIVGHATEITERKRRKERLERQNDLFERAQEIANVGAWEYDVKTGDLRCTRQTYRIHGYPVEEELPVEEAFSHYHPEGQAAIEEAVEEAVEEGASYDLELRLQAETGTERWVRDRGEPQWEDGEVVRIRGTLRDITERKEREQRLRQTETLFQNAQEPLFLLDVQENGERFAYERINPAYSKKFGRSEVEILGQSPRELFGDELGQFIETQCRACVREREPRDHEEQIPLEGEMTYWVTRIAPVIVEGKVQQIVGHATNITERKRREQKLREQGRRLEQIRRNVTDVVWMSPSDKSEIEFISKAYEAIWGRPAEELKERPGLFVEAIHPEDRERVQSAQEIQKQNPESYDEIYRVVRPDGEVRWVRDRSTGVYDENDRLTHIIGVATDITERKERERVLRERQEKIEALYEATQRLLTVEELREVSTRIHELLEAIFDYPLRNTGFVDGESIVPAQTSAEHALGVPSPERRTKDGDSLSARALRAGDTVVVDDASALDNDVEYGALRTAAAVPIGERGVVVIAKTEVDAFDAFNLRLIEVLTGYASLVLNRLDRETALREAKEEAEEASQMKSALLTNMSHEIRTPLTSIIGFAEVVGTQARDLDLPTGNPLPNFADRIEQGGKRLLDTLNGVLNLSKLEAGQMELDAEPVPLATEVQRVAEELGPKAQSKEIDLRLEMESARAEADRGGVQIVVRNLLSNAIKYTEAGGTVWVRTYQKEDDVMLEVEDTGIGMEPGAIEDLFEPFRQASRGLSREYEGTGVGLAVTKRATEKMGGIVDVDTEQGEGSRFTVRLPRARNKKARG